jgi:hypothetical protein
MRHSSDIRALPVTAGSGITQVHEADFARCRTVQRGGDGAMS